MEHIGDKFDPNRSLRETIKVLRSALRTAAQEGILPAGDYYAKRLRRDKGNYLGVYCSCADPAVHEQIEAICDRYNRFEMRDDHKCSASFHTRIITPESWKRPATWPKRGNDHRYLEKELKEKHPEAFERYLAGEFNSVFAACVSCGLRKRRITHGPSAENFAESVLQHLSEDEGFVAISMWQPFDV